MAQTAKNLPEPPAKETKSAKGRTLPFVKYYLVAYNTLLALGWSYVLVFILLHLTGLLESTKLVPPPHTKTATSTLGRILASIPYLSSAAPVSARVHARVPPALLPLYERATTTYEAVGPATAYVQSFAILEVVHALLGWVRSPVPTTAMQVASRLFLVWGVTEPFEVARTYPLYATMVFAWSLTEVIRYSFYACSLLGFEPYPLLFLRYTTFYVLYPLGAGSEAFVNYATLPTSSPFTALSSIFGGRWEPYDYIRGLLFLIWWPGLYVMYTYMMKQRRKVLGKGAGHKLGGKPKAKTQ